MATVPDEDCSELYRCYKECPAVVATFIRDFRVDDTVGVDVTLLEASDSAGWATLVSTIWKPADARYDPETLKREHHVTLKYLPKGHLDIPPDSVFLNNDMVAVDWANMKVAVFHIANEEQFNSLIYYQLNKVKNK